MVFVEYLPIGLLRVERREARDLAGGDRRNHLPVTIRFINFLSHRGAQVESYSEIGKAYLVLENNELSVVKMKMVENDK